MRSAWIQKDAISDICAQSKKSRRNNARLAKGDVALHLVDVDLTDGLAAGRPVHVDVHDMLGDRPVAVLIMVVLDDEDHVETRENCRLEVDVL